MQAARGNRGTFSPSGTANWRPTMPAYVQVPVFSANLRHPPAPPMPNRRQSAPKNFKKPALNSSRRNIAIPNPCFNLPRENWAKQNDPATGAWNSILWSQLRMPSRPCPASRPPQPGEGGPVRRSCQRRRKLSAKPGRFSPSVTSVCFGKKAPSHPPPGSNRLIQPRPPTAEFLPAPEQPHGGTAL